MADESTLLQKDAGGDTPRRKFASHWDRLPVEIKDEVLRHASLLTRFIHGRGGSAEDLDGSMRRELWLEVLATEWPGNLMALPGTGTLTTGDLAAVKSRAMYERLCARLPHATEANARFASADAACNRRFAPKLHSDANENGNDDFGSARLSSYSVPSADFLAARDLLRALPPLRLRHIAMQNGWTDVVDAVACPIAVAHDAIRFGHAAVLRHLVETGRIDVLQIESVPYGDYRVVRPHLAIDVAVAFGHVEVAQILHAAGSAACSTKALEWAAWHGRLDLIQWLHHHRSEGCTEAAMDGAAALGRLDIVQWLHTHRTEGCSHQAIEQAAECNHIHVVKWLLENRTEGFSLYVLEESLPVEMLRLLVTSLSESRRRDMLEDATRMGFTRAIRRLNHNYD